MKRLIIGLIIIVMTLVGNSCQRPVSNQILPDNTTQPLRAGAGFFPIGLYHVDEDKIEQIKEYGFNLSVGGSCGEISYLDKLNSLGMKAIPLTDFEKLDKYMEKRLNHPAVFAWYLVDEPDLNNIPQDKVSEMYRRLKATKTPYPAFLTIWSPKRYKDFIAFTDIFAPDPYPIRSKTDDNQNNIRNVERAMLKAKEADPNKQIITVVQAFSWEPEFPRMPTPQEERAMVYLALIHGSQGIIYFAYYDIFAEKGKEIREEIRRINNQLSEIGHLFLKPALPLDNKPAGSPANREKSIIPMTLRQDGDRFYLFAVNPDRIPHQIEMVLPDALTEKSIRVLFEEHRASTPNGVLKDQLAPLQVRIYEFSPDEEK